MQRFKYLPAMVLFTNISLSLCAYFLDKLSHISDSFIWLPFVFIQFVINLYYTLSIVRFHKGFYLDELTGLCNRRYFYRKLNQEIQRVKRTNSPLSLVLLDLDDFKNVNDTFGHLAGDKVLKEFAKLIKHNCRVVDIPSRWGGEEFAIILPATTSEGARIFAERLRETTEKYKFIRQVTISIGIATVDQAISVDQFVSAADRALYKAKEKKNTIVVDAFLTIDHPKIKDGLLRDIINSVQKLVRG